LESEGCVVVCVLESGGRRWNDEGNGMKEG
jgi:hypothetical protein